MPIQRPQGPDRAAARAARRVSVLQRGGRDDLRRQGAGAARPRPQLSRRLRHEPAHRRAARRGAAARGHRHRLGRRGARAREQPDQAARAAIQHPAARRQELPLPAADDQRGVSARAGRAPRRAGRQLLRRAVPAREARAPDDVADAPAVRHPLVQRGDHRRARRGRASSTTSSAASRRASRRSAAEEQYGGAVERHAAVPRGPQRRAGRRRCATRMADAAGGERFEEAAQLRDAMRTDRRRCATGSRRWRPPSSAIATCSASRSARPAPSCRSSRCAAAAWSSASSSAPTRAPIVGAARRARCCRRRCSSSTSCATAPPEIHLPVALDDARGARGWLPSAPAGACGSSCRSAARSAACSSWRRATPRSPIRRASTRTTPAHYDALETLRAVLGLPALPRRIECFDISTIQGSETVASMVVCEDGRMKRAEYRKFRIRRTSRARRPARSPSPPRSRSDDDFAAMREVVQRRYRKLLEHGGPFPDLILIDGGKGQLSAAYAALEELGLGESRGGRHRQEGGAALHARSRGADRARPRTIRRCCCCSGSATRRTASP